MIESQLNIEDYTVELENVPVDKYSQDPRILQMKLWLQIYEKAEKQMSANKFEEFQVVDLNMNMQKYKQMKLIKQMEHLTLKMKKV